MLLTKETVDGLADLVRSPVAAQLVEALLTPAALLAAALLFMEILCAAADWVRTVQSHLVEECVDELIHEKSTLIDIAFYELPEFHDHLHRARQEAGMRPIGLLENAGI